MGDNSRYNDSNLWDLVFDDCIKNFGYVSLVIMILTGILLTLNCMFATNEGLGCNYPKVLFFSALVCLCSIFFSSIIEDSADPSEDTKKPITIFFIGTFVVINALCALFFKIDVFPEVYTTFTFVTIWAMWIGIPLTTFIYKCFTL